MKRIIIISMLLSLTFSMGAQTDSLITEMLNAAVISDGNMTYKIDRPPISSQRSKWLRHVKQENLFPEFRDCS